MNKDVLLGFIIGCGFWVPMGILIAYLIIFLDSKIAIVGIGG